MTRAIISGALHKAAKEHTSKAGKQFVTFTLRENVNGTTRWWGAIAFDEAVIAAVLSMEIGEPFAAAGAIDAEIYAAAGSESRINWRITVDAVLSARNRRRSARRRSISQKRPTVAIAPGRHGPRRRPPREACPSMMPCRLPLSGAER